MYELRIAARYIKARSKQTLFTIIAVALTVVIVSTSMGIMGGFQKELIKKTVEKNPHIIVYPREKEDYIYLYKNLASYISSLQQVAGVSPRFAGEAALEYKDESQAVNLIGINPVSEDKVIQISTQMVEGEFLSLAHTSNTVVIGDKLAKKLEVEVGDVAVLSYPDARKNVRIIGLIHTGTSSDETLAYTSLFTAQSFYGVNDVVNEIAIRVDDIYMADEVSREIASETGYKAISWIESLSDLLVFIESQYGIILLYYGLIFIISGFGIANVLIMIVSAKTKEIGMLLAMGATRRSIAEIFIIQSMVFGSIGIVIGSAVAYILELLLQSYPISTPEEIYFGLTTLPVEISLQNFLIAAVFAFLISVVAGVYPALQASKLDPVEAIRVV